MNKTFKGAGAAVAAGVLLMGGAGSLAYWSGAGTMDGTTVSSGELALTAGVCDGWTLNATDPYTTQLLVPGDVLTNSCEYTIEAAGENLSATVAAVPPTFGDAALGTVTADFTILDGAGGDALDQDTVTEANNGHTIESSVTLTLPFGTEVDDTTQNQVAVALDAYTVTLTQDDPDA